MMEIHKLPQILETYFVDEARRIPTATFGAATHGDGFLGSAIRRLNGQGIMAGWAFPMVCPDDNNMAPYVALQYMRDTMPSGRWIAVISVKLMKRRKNWQRNSVSTALAEVRCRLFSRRKGPSVLHLQLTV